MNCKIQIFHHYKNVQLRDHVYRLVAFSTFYQAKRTKKLSFHKCLVTTEHFPAFATLFTSTFDHQMMKMSFKGAVLKNLRSQPYTRNGTKHLQFYKNHELSTSSFLTYQKCTSTSPNIRTGISTSIKIRT